MWNFIQTNWHKILVIILAIASAWKYIFTYIKPAVYHEKASQPINIILPKEGCTIIIKPLEKESPESH